MLCKAQRFRTRNFNAGRMYQEQQHIYNWDVCGVITHAPGYSFAPFFAGHKLLDTLNRVYVSFMPQRTYAIHPIGFGYNTFPSKNCAPRSNQPYSGWNYFYTNKHEPVQRADKHCGTYRFATNFGYNHKTDYYPYVRQKLVY